MVRLFRMAFWTVILMGAANAVGGEVPEALPVKLAEESRPCVSLTPQEVAVVRQRYQSEPWAKKFGDETLQKADKFLAKKPDIPHKGGQWTAWYSCAKCGVKLKGESPTKHVCPKCGQTYSGYPYDDVYVTQQHEAILGGLSDLAMAYVLSPKPQYARRVREILLEYASFYSQLPLHDYEGHLGDQALARGARLEAQTLNEAGSLVHFVQAYDLVYADACFTPKDREAIEKGLIRPMVATIQRNPWGRLNWQTWHNAAIGLAGFVLRDEKLVEQAINDPKNGFLFQMRVSVTGSGMWYEGAVGYHMYALKPNVILAEAAYRAGIDLFQLDPLKKMFYAPTDLLMPDGDFAPLNDSHRMSLSSSRAIYESAYRHYNDGKFAPFLDPRDSWEALFWGAKELPKGAKAQVNLSSRPGEADGLAILRAPGGKTALFLDYTKSTSQHAQPVRLHVLLYAQGEIRFVDPETFPYGNPLHQGWGRQTFAHNTVVVDETIQEKSAGELKAYGTGADWTLARAVTAGAYKDVVLDRTVFLRDGVILDVFRCKAAKDSTFDLPLHLRGTLAGLPQSDPMEKWSASAGYCLAKDVRKFAGPLTGFDLGTGEGRRIAVSVFDVSEAYQARGYSQDTADLVPMILRRQKGKTATFVAAYQILDKGQKPQKVTAEIGNDVKMTVGTSVMTVGDGTHLTVDGKDQPLEVKSK